MPEMPHRFSLHTAVFIQETAAAHPEFRIHPIQISTYPGKSRQTLHRTAFPSCRHGTKTRPSRLCVQGKPVRSRIHPLHIQSVAFHRKQSSAHFQKKLPVPVPFLAKHSHVQTDFLITIAIIIINRHNDLSRQLPAVSHIPLHSGCQVHQHLIYLIMKNITIMQFGSHKHIHPRVLCRLRPSGTNKQYRQA